MGSLSHKSMDVQLLKKMLLLGKQNKKSTFENGANLATNEIPLGAFFLKNTKQKNVQSEVDDIPVGELLSNSIAEVDTFIDDSSTVHCTEYPNNFNEMVRPFQRPFHLF